MKLKIVQVHNHGDASEEYVLLEATEDCNINRYAIYDATYSAPGKMTNKQRHFYRFHDKIIKAGELVSLRTGTGKTAVVENGKGNTVHRFYWGLKHPVWNDEGDKAVLIEIYTWQTTDVRAAP